ncbi:unnamed protein product [Closterium sp. Naga37s-1]|nr:unnamed protein product [Closterium sp. Naga37s-1]
MPHRNAMPTSPSAATHALTSFTGTPARARSSLIAARFPPLPDASTAPATPAPACAQHPALLLVAENARERLAARTRVAGQEVEVLEAVEAAEEAERSREAAKRGNGESEKWGNGESGNQGSGEAGKRGGGEAGRRGSGEAEKQGSGEAEKRGSGEAGTRGSGEAGRRGSGEEGKRGSREKIDLNNMDEEMAEKEPAENSPAKNPLAAENSKEQEEESQEDDIELEGEEDILHVEIAKLQDHVVEQDTRIQQQQSLITNLKRELFDQDNKIKYLEVELKNMKHDAREHVHQLARQTSKINELHEAFRALRRETMFCPAPRADPPANSTSGRTHPSRSGGVAGDPGPSTQRAAELNMQVFCSLPITLPPFIHGKTDMAAWLSMMTDLFKAHKVHDDARVIAATTVLDQNAQRVVYGSKIQAEADSKPFGWEEFASALKQAFQVQPTQLEVRICLEKLQCGNRTVQQYAVEFEEIWVLQKPAERMSEGKKIHLFFKGLPEHLQSMHMTDGAGESWRSYDHVKRMVGTTDKHFRAYAKTTTQPQQASMPSSSPAGPSGRQQATPWKGGNHKRPF